MEYSIFCFEFPNGVHLGEGSLDSTEYTFSADTLFSALYIEALRMDLADTLLSYVKGGKLLLSDAFPFMGDVYYLPKPMVHIEAREQGDSKAKKAYKKMKYLQADQLENYLSGNLSADEIKGLQDLGTPVMRVSAFIGEEQTEPYRVASYYFNEGNGLYVLAGYENDEVKGLLISFLDSLSLSGIGGRRSSGFGRFDLTMRKVPAALANRIGETGKLSMSLSVSLPRSEEMESAVDGASYLLKKRSGFIYSDTYAETLIRKKDIYIMQAGSCFTNVFDGDVYDVAVRGTHPVYRYAKPLWMEVE